MLSTLGTLIPSTSVQTLTTALLQKDNQAGSSSAINNTAGSSKTQTIPRPSSYDSW
jgi:hypothetical protein